MFDMKKKAKTREYTKIASDVEQPPCRFVCQPPKSDLRDGRKRLIIAILFCLFFIICEITGEIVADFDFVYLIAIITIHSLDFSSYFRLFVWCTYCKIQLHLVSVFRTVRLLFLCLSFRYTFDLLERPIEIHNFRHIY